MDLDLTVIILSYNTKDVTSRCLKRLQSSVVSCQTKFKNKITTFVVDNGSIDGSAQMIKTDYPWVKLIESKENTGFSKGNNIVMRKAKTSFVLLLNSDVYLEEESLYKAIAYFRVNLNCDVMGARLNYPDGRLQSSSGNLPNPLNIIFWILGLGGFHPKGKNYFSKAHQVGWVMGAFLMLKKKVFDSTGGFDENIFMHMEEVEWCKRIKNKGFKIWYVPQVEVVHLHGASTNLDLTSSFANELKGIKYYVKKHYPFSYLPVKFFLLVGLVLRAVAFWMLKNPKRAKVYWEGLGVV
ncbi:MAG: glycosyltransferase family 2 protein [Patescibacteria group bacterium]